MESEREKQARRQTQLSVSADVEVHSQKQQAGATPSNKQEYRRPDTLEQLNEPCLESLALRSEEPPKIVKEVPRYSTEGKCEAGPGPSTLANRSRSFQDAISATVDDVPATAVDSTHEELFLKNFLEAHHQRMRAHAAKERSQQAERIQQAGQAGQAFELEAQSPDATFTTPRPAPQLLAHMYPHASPSPMESHPSDITSGR